MRYRDWGRMRIVDLRSDTVTKPTPEMRAAMATAPVGDDVFEDDPTVKQLEEKVAQLFGVDRRAGIHRLNGAV